MSQSTWADYQDRIVPQFLDFLEFVMSCLGQVSLNKTNLVPILMFLSIVA